MNPPDFLATLARLGLNQSQAAILLGVSRGAVTRWAQGTRQIPGPVARLLGAAEAVPGVVGYLRSNYPPDRHVASP